MIVIECTERRFVFDDSGRIGENGPGLSFLIKLLQVGCFLPSLLIVWSGVSAVLSGNSDSAFLSLSMGLFAAAITWVLLRGIYGSPSQAGGVLRYTFARGETALIESYHPGLGLAPVDTIALDEDSHLRYWTERITGTRQRGSYGPRTTTHDRAGIVQADGTVVRLRSQYQETAASVLTRLLNISRATGLPIQLDGVELPRPAVGELSFSRKFLRLVSDFRDEKGVFQYRLRAGARNVPFFLWLILGAFLGLSLASALFAEYEAQRSTWSLIAAAMALISFCFVIDYWILNERLQVDGAGFEFWRDGEQRARYPLSELLELRVLTRPKSEFRPLNYTVGLFFPGQTELLFEHHRLSYSDAQQVLQRIAGVVKEYGVPVPDGPFGSSVIQNQVKSTDSNA